MTQFDRRSFILGSAALGFGGGIGALGALSAGRANAANTSGYKALVCLFLKGGMDHGDTVLPYDQVSYDALRASRRTLFDRYAASPQGNSRARTALLPLTPATALANGRQFALPPQFSGLKTLFDAGQMAVIGNVGPLIQPTSRIGFENETTRVPPRLFSHNDQQSTWMALNAEGARYGWGGRFADAALRSRPSDNPLFSAISVTGNEVFLSGEVARQFRVTSGGAPEATLLADINYIGRGAGPDSARTRLKAFLSRQTVETPNLFARDLAGMLGRTIANNDAYRAADIATPDVTTVFPATSLGSQMRTIAQVIASRTALNVSRQVFIASIGGFDTHDNQSSTLPGLQTQIDQATTAFSRAMQELRVWNDVTVFTASDFGRTTIENGDGTDHGWGAHHFVIGGSVRGKDIYGAIPDQDLTGAQYTSQRGRLIPGVSVDQFAATLGRWFGLDASELNAAFPNLSRFPTSNLGFLP
jgi:uncharacterized protein (DUF1501 family)